MTKHLHEDNLKPLGIDDAKIEIIPAPIDQTLIISRGEIVRKPRNKMKVRVAKSKMTVKKSSQLCKATNQLYDLEDAHQPEKPLNIDLGLYQMEDY